MNSITDRKNQRELRRKKRRLQRIKRRIVSEVYMNMNFT